MSISTRNTITDPEARFFLHPKKTLHKHYEALRCFFIEKLPSHSVARRFGYSPGAFRVLCHAFVRDPHPCFFVSSRTGPRSQPKKSAARSLVIALRKQNHSVYEISQALKEQRPTFLQESEQGIAPNDRSTPQ